MADSATTTSEAAGSSGQALYRRFRAQTFSQIVGQDAVVQTLGVKAGPEMVIRGTKLFSKATRVLVEAMQAEGVARLVALTGFGAGDSRNQGGCLYDLGFNAVLGRVYDDKSVQEHLIRSSDLAWTIARPVILTDRPATHRYRVVLDPADWRPGDDVIISPAGNCNTAKDRMDGKDDNIDDCKDWFFCTKKISEDKVLKTVLK